MWQRCAIKIENRRRSATLVYEQTGLVEGFDAPLLGFVCPQPFAEPRSVSSVAALNAAPQFASLEIW